MTIEFLKLKDELIAMYTPAYGAEDILKRRSFNTFAGFYSI